MYIHTRLRSMHNVALGTKVFSRAEKLTQLLASVEKTGINKVYVADDGKPTDMKANIYSCEYDFELEVLNLEYDAGLGAGRKRIVEQFDRDYLLIVDTDHEIPRNVDILRDQLEARQSIGGIAGTIVEPNKGRVFQSAKDLYEEGNVLVRSADINDKSIEFIANHAFVPFQFIPNAAMFRRECLEDYSWDPYYVIGKEHIDFYVGHWKRTDWTFGVAPEVFFRHYPGGDQVYENNRFNDGKLDKSTEYFRKKWNYNQLRTDRSFWFDTEPQPPSSTVRDAKELLEDQGLSELLQRSVKAGPRILRRLYYQLVR